MTEINLMERYPQTKRNLSERSQEKTEEDRVIAGKFGKEYFDGDRKYGYGGYSYHPRFFSEVVEDMVRHYGLSEGSKILDVGCAKGFMLHDFKRLHPEIIVRGIDISEYSIENSKPEVREFLSVGNARDLSEFGDDEFNLVISINTIHNLPLENVSKHLKKFKELEKIHSLQLMRGGMMLEKKT